MILETVFWACWAINIGGIAVWARAAHYHRRAERDAQLLTAILLDITIRSYRMSHAPTWAAWCATMGPIEVSVRPTVNEE
jgi:hypothetical protein